MKRRRDETGKGQLLWLITDVILSFLCLGLAIYTGCINGSMLDFILCILILVNIANEITSYLKRKDGKKKKS